jgi:hypothetical protein
MMMELKTTTNDTMGCKAIANLSACVSGGFCGVASLWMASVEMYTGAAWPQEADYRSDSPVLSSTLCECSI